MTFEENIDSEFIDAYNNAYDEIQEQLKMITLLKDLRVLSKEKDLTHQL
ncbi:hypothetical protein [Clostridioides difficile]|nr:hypothetical protein [Clostridioides difficile]MBT2158431.1 hypothetical protein [Clostridioides difficile]MBT2158974.1 hypothetical protein [Clostridioides difficile]